MLVGQWLIRGEALPLLRSTGEHAVVGQEFG